MGNISLMLVYEPSSADSGPVPLVRVRNNAGLARAIAESGISEAEARARELSSQDEVLGEIEMAEVRRLREVLILLVPGFGKRPEVPPKNPPVM